MNNFFFSIILYILMSKIYNIIFSGAVGTNVVNITNSCTFYFDWGQLPKNKKWKCTTTFNGAAFNWTSTNTCSLYINLGNIDSDIAFNAAASSPISRGHQYAGLLQASNSGNSCYFNSKYNANNHFFLEATPNNNNVDILLLNPNQTLFTTTWSSYTLMLTMEMIDDEKIVRPIKYESYNVAFLSSQSTYTTSPAAYNFFVNWLEVLPKEGKYYVRFAFMSNDSGTISYSANNVFIDLGQGQTVLWANSQNNNILFKRTSILGTLYTNGRAGYYDSFTAGIEENPPIYLNCRPVNNNVVVSFLNGYNPQGFRSIGEWEMVLNFEYLGE